MARATPRASSCQHRAGAVSMWHEIAAATGPNVVLRRNWQSSEVGDPSNVDEAQGFYGPDSVMWRINREAVLLGAGPTALLLQIAHPLVAEGVAQHSRYESDPFGRLHGTLRTTLELIFGDRRMAERAVRRLNAIHSTVRGAVGDDHARRLADAYRALDPSLLLWVQATLFATSLAAYERWVGQISGDDRERYWQETRAVGQRLGIPLSRSPGDYRAFLGYWHRMLDPTGPIHVTHTARRISRGIIHPPLPLVPAPLVDLLALPGLALLEPRLRAAYGIPWSPAKDRLARLGHIVVRTYVRALPRSWRAMPHARAAERRVRVGP